MKLTKTEFKTLMKECLSELINEGAFDKKLEKIAESKIQVGVLAASNKKIMSEIKGGLAASSEESSQLQEINPRLFDAVKAVNAFQPSDRKKLFEEIMLDTAMTTLQKQMANGDGFGNASGLYQNMPVAPETIANDAAQLEALSGGNVSRWALAAFGGNKK
jgi:hypothetical protein